MLAPSNPIPTETAALAQSPANELDALLALARFDAIVTLRRLLTEPPLDPAVARELRMTAAAIFRIAPFNPPQDQRVRLRPAPPPPAPANPLVADTELSAPAPAPAPEPTCDPAAPPNPFQGLGPDETIRLANEILFPRRTSRGPAARLRAKSGAAASHAHDSS